MICSPFSASTKSKKISKAALTKSLVAFARTLEIPIQFFIAGINLHLCFSFLIEKRKITNMYFPRWQNHISQKRLFQYVLSPLPDKWKDPWGRGAAWASFAAVNIILFHFLCQHKHFQPSFAQLSLTFAKSLTHVGFHRSIVRCAYISSLSSG